VSDLIGMVIRVIDPWVRIALQDYPYQTLGVLAMVAGGMQVMSVRALYKAGRGTR
jgi:hypothetical protein